MTTGQRTRLDALLVQRGVADTVERARALIAAGLVVVGEARGESASQGVEAGTDVRVIGRGHRWAGRGGLKLDAALDAFGVEVAGRVCLDAGASTGGFTDVLLSRGAGRVYAVDVGRGQLDGRLAGDPRVVVMDRTNIRTLTTVGGPLPTLVTLDLSFISLRAVLPTIARLAPGAEVVALFKPQFEVARADVGPGGVVRDPHLTAAAVAGFRQWARVALGATAEGEPLAAEIRGAKGNQEWLVHLRLAGAAS